MNYYTIYESELKEKRKRNSGSSDVSFSSQQQPKKIKDQLSFTENQTVLEIDNGAANMAETMEQVVERAMARQLTVQLEPMRIDLAEIKSSITQDVNELKGKVFDLELENISLRNRVEHIEEFQRNHNQNVQNAQNKAIENDQYARRSNIILYGIRENAGEELKPIVVDLIKSKIKITLKPYDIEVCHRVGTTVLGKSRPIVIRFRFRDTKWDIMKQRKCLKGTGIVMGEDLCRELRDLQKKIGQSQGVADTWAWNGKVFAKNLHGKIFSIRYGEDWRLKFPIAQSTPGQQAEQQPAADVVLQVSMQSQPGLHSPGLPPPMLSPQYHGPGLPNGAQSSSTHISSALNMPSLELAAAAAVSHPPLAQTSVVQSNGFVMHPSRLPHPQQHPSHYVQPQMSQQQMQQQQMQQMQHQQMQRQQMQQNHQIPRLRTPTPAKSPSHTVQMSASTHSSPHLQQLPQLQPPATTLAAS